MFVLSVQGSAGAIIAEKLANKGKSVGLLKRGGYYERRRYESARIRHDAFAMEKRWRQFYG